MSKIEFEINGKPFLKKERYSVKILRCGQAYCPGDKKNYLSKRPYYSLHFVLHGKGTLQFGADKQSTQIGKGGAFLLFADDRYEYVPDRRYPWSYVWIDFTGEEMDELMAACGFRRDKPYITIHDYAPVVLLLEQLMEVYDASETEKLQCSAYMMLLLAQLIGNERSKSKEDKQYLEKYKRVRDILIYINSNFSQPLTIEKIAANNYLSPSYLMAIFSEVVGMSPIEYLNAFRIASACLRFQHPELSEWMYKTPSGNLRVETVAHSVGFTDPLYFSRVFKKLKGMSPRDYCKIAETDDPFRFLKEKDIDFR